MSELRTFKFDAQEPDNVLARGPFHHSSESPRLNLVSALYSKSARGEPRLAATELLAALPTLNDTNDAPAERALFELCAAEIVARTGQFRSASEFALNASEALIKSDPSDLELTTGIAARYRLWAEGVALTNKFVRDFQNKHRLGEQNFALAIVDLAAGNQHGARMRLGARTRKSGWLSLYGEALRTEVALELGSIAGASESLARLLTTLTFDARFTDLHLHVLVLEVWLTLARPEDDANESIKERLERLQRSSAASSFYKAIATQFYAEYHTAFATGVASAAFFDDALQQAEAIESDYLSAWFLARRLNTTQSAQARALQPLSERTRKLLTKVGASRRFTNVAAASTAPQVTRQSIALRLQQTSAPKADATLETVTEVTRVLASVTDPNELAERVLSSVVRLMQADRGALFLLDDKGAPILSNHTGPGVENATGSRGVITEVLKSGETVLTQNAMNDARFQDRQSVQLTETGSVLAAPLRTPNATFGAIYLDRKAFNPAFTPEHEDLLAIFVTQVSVAIENAKSFEQIRQLNEGLENKVKERTLELRTANNDLQNTLDELKNTRLRLVEAERDAMQKELRLAQDIQRRMLPEETPISINGLSVLGRVLPASYCGGDFWKVHSLSETQTFFLIADVSGHGVAAALMTAVLRAASDAIENATDLEHTLARLSRAVALAGKQELLATAIACIVDTEKNTLQFASAAHNPPIVVRQGQKPATIPMGGTQLGRDDFLVVQKEVSFEKGDRLLLYTDGIVEWENPKGREFGLKKLMRAIAASENELIDDLFVSAETFASGIERDDDLTLVSIAFD